MNRRQLAADHVWIARYHAKRLSGTIDYWDLLSIGHLALVQAAKSWPGKQAFVPYATSKVVWKIRDAIRDAGRYVRKSQISNTINQKWDDPGHEQHISGYDKFEAADENETPDSVYYVREWLSELPADEQQAIRLAYGIGTRKRTTVEIARRLKLPQHVANDVIKSGLLRLRFMATCEQVNG